MSIQAIRDRLAHAKKLNLDPRYFSNAGVTVSELEAALVEYDRLRQATQNLVDATARTRKADDNVKRDPNAADWAELEDAYASLIIFENAARALLRPAEQPDVAQPDLRDFTEKLWNAVNERRCELIQLKVKHKADAAQLSELANLQALADERIQLFAPLPIEGLKAYMREHGIEIPEQPDAATESNNQGENQ